jgi:hypothetical protein
MWGRHRKRKRGGQLERQLALGRLEDALAQVDGVQEDSTRAEERQREEAQRGETEREVTGQREPGARGEPASAAAADNSEVPARRTRHGSFG